ncbi:hypothetical protein U9M48_032277 [Paspalum notatum var. saurae]|uniref:Reverse transcriptase domain-containing protein n=1 Tax=Paspalum notatum var. saurae TaxID=547442 RepID=A0AAQ3U914_PASNO
MSGFRARRRRTLPPGRPGGSTPVQAARPLGARPQATPRPPATPGFLVPRPPATPGDPAARHLARLAPRPPQPAMSVAPRCTARGGWRAQARTRIILASIPLGGTTVSPAASIPASAASPICRRLHVLPRPDVDGVSSFSDLTQARKVFDRMSNRQDEPFLQRLLSWKIPTISTNFGVQNRRPTSTAGSVSPSIYYEHKTPKKADVSTAEAQEDGRVITKHDEKERIVNEFYCNLLGENMDRDSTIDLNEVHVPSYDLTELEAPFSEEEVWRTINSLPSDKAPGPDGFIGKFYKSCWQIIKVEIMAAVSAIWSRKMRNFEQLNSAYITLLPKKEGATNVKDFRPISLVHSFAKLITKLLANRLAGRLDQMVSPNQSAFIKGRFIQDNFMLVQQTARFLHQQKQARLLLKLDITKAFDSVSWPFLLEIMKHLGFGPVWCDIISGLLATASTQVLINGSPGERIVHRRGLRQGDPLSPMLFILVMDVLCYMIKKASDEGLLQSLARRALQHRISLYADDVVIFLRPSASDISITLDILKLFGEASGLRTNMHKSNVFPIQCSEEDTTFKQDHLPCQVAEFPCKYIGVPLSLKKLTKQQIQPIIDRIADQLPGWKADLLTKAGRRILVQFVLTSMLVYLTMAMDLPLWALKAIDKIRRGFLWRGRRDVKGGHCLLAWPKVTRPLELGVKAFFEVAIVSEVGNGKNTIFWTDKWVQGQSLAQLAPNLFGSITNKAKRRTVFEAATDLRWVQDIRGAITVPVLAEFFKIWDLLSNLVLQPEIEDTHRWQFSSSGVYSTKSAYGGFFIGAVQFGPWERIWKTWAPGKCKFFMWLVAHNRCWTANRLAKRGLPHPERCLLCDQAEETIDHLLISCVFARQAWYSILQQVGLQALSPQPENGSFDEWWASANLGISDQIKKGLNSVIVLGAWSIWNHRNRCVFNGIQPNLNEVLVLFRDELHLWSVAGARGISNLLALVPANGL